MLIAVVDVALLEKGCYVTRSDCWASPSTGDGVGCKVSRVDQGKSPKGKTPQPFLRSALHHATTLHGRFQCVKQFCIFFGELINDVTISSGCQTDHLGLSAFEENVPRKRQHCDTMPPSPVAAHLQSISYPSRQVRAESARDTLEAAKGQEGHLRNDGQVAACCSDGGSSDAEIETAREPPGDPPEPLSPDEPSSALRSLISLNEAEVAALARRLLSEEFNSNAANAAADALAGKHVCGKTLLKCKEKHFEQYGILGPHAEHLLEKRDEFVNSGGVPTSLLLDLEAGGL